MANKINNKKKRTGTCLTTVANRILPSTNPHKLAAKPKYISIAAIYISLEKCRVEKKKDRDIKERERKVPSEAQRGLFD